MGDFPNSGMLAPTSLIGLFDSKRYSQLAKDNAAGYQAQKPFPHTYFDFFLDLPSYIATHFPYDDAPGWTVHDHNHANRKFLGDITKYDDVFRTFAMEVNSRSFLLFLETLTGIKHLLPDPYFIGGGAMTAGPGDKLDMHVDFNWHYGLHLHRRVNALFYLTPHWMKDWGGALRLEDENHDYAKEYDPFFGRVVIFSTNENSWHGQPKPITSPPGILRRCFSAFYYTATSPADLANPHLTKYREETPYTAGPLKDYQA